MQFDDPVSVAHFNETPFEGQLLDPDFMQSPD